MNRRQLLAGVIAAPFVRPEANAAPLYWDNLAIMYWGGQALPPLARDPLPGEPHPVFLIAPRSYDEATAEYFAGLT